ncbi:MAG: hypothetical protein ACI4U1_04705 [Anaerovoracaceae bacterium]
MNSRQTEKKQNTSFSDGQMLKLSIILALIALVSMTAASVAWFSLADYTRVSCMSMDITSGTNMRFDLDPHDTFEQYVKTLTFSEIADRMLEEKGYDSRVTPLEPVTTTDVVTFTYEDGKPVSDTSGAYLEFTLHFMATSDMYVHLTSANSAGKTDGTDVSSKNENLPAAMRISFTVGDRVYIYSPRQEQARETGKIKSFGLPPAENMVLNEDNKMFFLKENEDQPVIVHVWLEGTDEFCTDELRKADYSIRLRFVGTDENNEVLDGSR